MKIAALILSLYLLFKPMIPLLEYAAFYDYIKNELCVNKDIPESTCDGKCYLAKQLAKASDSEKDNEKDHSFIVEYSIVFFQKIIINCLFPFSTELTNKLIATYNKIYKFHYINTIFHPPII
ncbi:hypothetical protein EGM88_01645 [Aureibaculum marinum]|uniref:Uncharacterized protein n=1 Tax=Aureibaculum marinum TaxID=2487930 RepID=A0A3N4NUE2_9FLAO|nr:hypothetical protein [Aureibaculum marinum]RPD99992.1 hypothetical protein EGM88_01645 [Aureibaculum marinum]